MSQYTFLEPTAHGAKATKRFSLDKDGNLDSDYITGAYFTSHTEEHTTLLSLYTSIQSHAGKYHALLKGNVTRPLVNERRRGTTDSEEKTNWVVFDIDGLPSISSAKEFMEKLGYGKAEYIVQYSSSMGVNPTKGLSAHIIARLDKSYTPAYLKQWLKYLNLNNSFLATNLKLTATNNSLSWPLDITTCQNDKLIFIAPPEVTNGIKDTFKGPRFEHNIGSFIIQPKMEIGFSTKILISEQTQINTIRQTMGLKSKTFKMAIHSTGVEYSKAPDRSTITGVKLDGDYIRINLNNGDSWAYYHPITSAEILYNFKGEDNYLLKELAPDYYAAAKGVALEAKKSEDARTQKTYLENTTAGEVYLGVRDAATDQYYTIKYDHDTKDLEANPARSKERVNDYLQDNKQPPLDYIPDWNVSYDIDSDKKFDLETRNINLFSSTLYFERPDFEEVKKQIVCPPNIYKLIKHVAGNCEKTTQTFLNWIAYIVQVRETPRSTWLFHGTFGTGKGILFTDVLKPIFGDIAVKKPFTDFDDKFNAQLARTLLVCVDETDLRSSDNGNKMIQRFKNLITEKEVSIRAMRSDYSEHFNRTAYIFFSNAAIPVPIELRDRRWNIAPRQEKPLKDCVEDLTSFLKDIENEVSDFAMFLHSYEVNSDAARFPPESDAKKALQNLSTTTPALFAESIATGDLEFFTDFLPASLVDSSKQALSFANPIETNFIALMAELIKTLPPSAEPVEMFIPRDDLQTLYMFTTNERNQSPAKFTRMMKGYNVKMDIKRRVDGALHKGTVIRWIYNDIELMEFKKAVSAHTTLHTHALKVAGITNDKTH